MIRSKINFFLVCLASLFICVSCQTENLDDYNPVLIAADERELGNALYKTVIDNPTEFELLDPVAYSSVYGYLEEAWDMVKNQTVIRDYFDWQVLVFNDDTTLRAFTMPGGKFGISTGMLKHLSKEHQLFSLMAHEAYYNDRVNQNSTDALSLAMEKLKFMVSVNDGVGTKIFKDVINGSSDMNVSMVYYCMEMDYDPKRVFEADEYAITRILCPHTYSPMGIKEIILEAQQNTLTNFHWMNKRPPSIAVNTDNVYTLVQRENNLLEYESTVLNSSDCENSEDAIDTDDYLDMMSALP